MGLFGMHPLPLQPTACASWGFTCLRAVNQTCQPCAYHTIARTTLPLSLLPPLSIVFADADSSVSVPSLEASLQCAGHGKMAHLFEGSQPEGPSRGGGGGGGGMGWGVVRMGGSLRRCLPICCCQPSPSSVSCMRKSTKDCM
eukprot:1158865-Pelagomonas_calceolata.AAC.1